VWAVVEMMEDENRDLHDGDLQDDVLLRPKSVVRGAISSPRAS